MIQAILFDKDGTLTDFRATWGSATGEMLRALAGGDAARAARLGALAGYDMASGAFVPHAPIVTATAVETAAALAPEAGMTPREVEAYLTRMARNVRQVPVCDLASLFAELRGRGLRLGVITNDDEASARDHLEGWGLSGMIEAVIGHDSGWGAKPAPGGALHFADLIGLPPARVALVGDGMTDIRAARGAGMRAVAVLTGALGADALAPHADVVLSDVAALPSWLDEG